MPGGGGVGGGKNTANKSSSSQIARTSAGLLFRRGQDSGVSQNKERKIYSVQAKPALIISTFLEEHEELEEKQFFLVTAKPH